MAITARTAVYSGSPKKIKKNVTWDQAANAPINISAFEEIDDLTCDFILDGHGYHSKNYMEVSWDNGVVKYYFIESRAGLTGDRTKVRGVCDVLSTYQSTVLDAEAVLNRTSYSTQTLVDPMLRDNKVTTTSRTVISSEVIQENIIGNTEWFYVGIVQNMASPTHP